MRTAFAYLGTECCVFMEIAMHELTVLPSGDLAAVDRKRIAVSVLKSICLLRLEPSTWARQAGWSKLPSISLALSSLPPITQGQRTEVSYRGPSACRGWDSGSPALGADAAGAAFDLTVYVQQACVVAWALLCADLREREPMAVGLMTESRLSPPSSYSLLHASPTHRPLGNVIRPDVGPTGGWLFTGPGSSGQIGQNGELGHPSLPHPPPASQRP